MIAEWTQRLGAHGAEIDGAELRIYESEAAAEAGDLAIHGQTFGRPLSRWTPQAMRAAEARAMLQAREFLAACMAAPAD